MREVVHIAENRAADLHLGHPGLLRTIGKGTRAAAAHDLDSIAGFPAGAGARREQGDGGADRSLLLGRIGEGRGVSLPSHHTRETQTGAIGDLARERNNRCARLDARAVHADVDLDRHAQPLVGSREGRIELREILDAVGTDDRVGAIGQIDQPADLDRPHDLVGDQDIADARGGHHLGFAQLRASDAGRAGSDLHVCDLRRLVRLGMRPPRDAVRAARGDDACDVRFHDVEIDQQRRRIQRRLVLADEAVRCGGSGVHV